MKGFTDRALILLCRQEVFDEYAPTYQYDYKQAVRNVIAYLDSQEVAHDCLITDSLATTIDMQQPQWLATGAPEDMFFIQHNCGVPSYTCTPLPDDIVTTLRKKYPIPRGMEPKERFAIVAKRVEYAEKTLIESYNFVVIMGRGFRAKTKENDGRAVLRIDGKTLIPTLEISGTTTSPADFLGIPYGNLCVSEWRKYNA